MKIIIILEDLPDALNLEEKWGNLDIHYKLYGDLSKTNCDFYRRINIIPTLICCDYTKSYKRKEDGSIIQSRLYNLSSKIEGWELIEEYLSIKYMLEGDIL